MHQVAVEGRTIAMMVQRLYTELSEIGKDVMLGDQFLTGQKHSQKGRRENWLFSGGSTDVQGCRQVAEWMYRVVGWMFKVVE